MRPIEVLPVQQAMRRLEHPRADEPAHRVVDGVPRDGCENEQPEHRRRVQPTGRAERARREQERIAGQKRRDDKARFGEHDGKQDRIHPRAVIADELDEVLVEVQEEVEHLWSLVLSSWSLVRP